MVPLLRIGRRSIYDSPPTYTCRYIFFPKRRVLDDLPAARQSGNGAPALPVSQFLMASTSPPRRIVPGPKGSIQVPCLGHEEERHQCDATDRDADDGAHSHLARGRVHHHLRHGEAFDRDLAVVTLPTLRAVATDVSIRHVASRHIASHHDIRHKRAKIRFIFASTIEWSQGSTPRGNPSAKQKRKKVGA
jgi:hypothetical protein